MEDLGIEITPKMLMMVPLVAAAVQWLKSIEPLAKLLKDWLPLVNVLISLVLSYFVQPSGAGPMDWILPGIIVGLVAGGGYDILKQKPAIKLSKKVESISTGDNQVIDGVSK